MKRKMIPDPVLMVIAISVILGFQVYWLKDNYDREKKNLQIKTSVAFQQTIHQLQASKLKLPLPFINDSNHQQKTRIFLNEDEQQELDEGSMPRRQIITMINSIRDKLHDSLKIDTALKTTIVFTMHGHDSLAAEKDDMPLLKNTVDSNKHMFNILYKVDSLQDSIRLPEITKSYAATLQKQNINVPFTIIRSIYPPHAIDEQDMSSAVVGFAHPVTYKLLLKNTNGYLLNKIILPILFSLFLAAVTIISFWLLYRNLIRQHRLAEIKNDFISNITHELKTPLATVGVAIEALRKFNAIDDPHKTKEYLDISSNELRRLSLLVDKVLRLSMFEKKEIELNKEQFDLKLLTAEVLDTMKPQFDKHSAAVSFTSQGDDFNMIADKLHITSVIYNLLDNAIKYSSENITIGVTLAAQKNTHAQNIFELKISDNGIGIAPEYKHKIFDKFFRVPTGNMHTVKGYGLGLSYVSEIIHRHMGYIYAESEPGKGSTFIARFPAEEASTIWYGERQVVRKFSLPIKKTESKNGH